MSRILIVEDESATAWAIAESLQDDGLEAKTVSDAETARELIASESIDLVITDLRLPGSSGLFLAQWVRARGATVPIIVLTAYGSREVLEELESCGVHAVFRKPFRVDQLRRSVRDALEAGAAADRLGSRESSQGVQP